METTTKPTTRSRRPKAAPVALTASPAPATLPAVPSVAPATGDEGKEGTAREVVRLQKLLRSAQGTIASLTAAQEPAKPISDGDLKPLLAEHIRTGASIGRHELTPAQKLLWKETKASRKATVNGRIYRKRILGNVTRAANEGAFSRYRERVSAKSKRLAGFTLGAAFKAPKAAKQ